MESIHDPYGISLTELNSTEHLQEIPDKEKPPSLVLEIYPAQDEQCCTSKDQNQQLSPTQEHLPIQEQQPRDILPPHTITIQLSSVFPWCDDVFL